ncbi:MAG: energy transducer TonB, partial [Acidobacteriota bacterium]|nr:energy transducer TonB [Acidobacteriota bacterium]
MNKALLIPLVLMVLCVATSVFAEERPMLAGSAGVSNPSRIEDSYVRPVYPEEARENGVEGKVILQAVITKDGTVEEIQVLSSRNPGHGFED